MLGNGAGESTSWSDTASEEVVATRTRRSSDAEEASPGRIGGPHDEVSAEQTSLWKYHYYALSDCIWFDHNLTILVSEVIL
jgi:hypothetical protein